MACKGTKALVAHRGPVDLAPASVPCSDHTHLPLVPRTCQVSSGLWAFFSCRPLCWTKPGTRLLPPVPGEHVFRLWRLLKILCFLPSVGLPLSYTASLGCVYMCASQINAKPLGGRSSELTLSPRLRLRLPIPSPGSPMQSNGCGILRLACEMSSPAQSQRQDREKGPCGFFLYLCFLSSQSPPCFMTWVQKSAYFPVNHCKRENVIVFDTHNVHEMTQCNV